MVRNAANETAERRAAADAAANGAKVCLHMEPPLELLFLPAASVKADKISRGSRGRQASVQRAGKKCTKESKKRMREKYDPIKMKTKKPRKCPKIEKSVDRWPLFRVYSYVAGLSSFDDGVLLCFVNTASQYVVILPYDEEENIMKRTFQPKKRHRAVTHGFLARSRSRSGRRVLNARRAKGRARLTV